jgi:hypothetical protein
MSSSLIQFLQVTKNLARYQKLTAAEPIVKAQTKYYQDNIGKVKTSKELVDNYRLFSYAMTAYGLGDKIYAKGMMKKVLEQGVDSKKDLAYNLKSPAILAFAQAFNFAANGDKTTSSTAVTKTVVDKYIEQQLEADQGQTNPAVQMALYFKNNAAGIKSTYNLLADKTFLTVVKTAYNISDGIAHMNIDRQAAMLDKVVKVKDFQDPEKLQKFLQRFCTMYDMNNPSANTAVSDALTLLGVPSGG